MSSLAQAQCFCPSVGMIGTNPANSRRDEDRISLLQMALPACEQGDNQESDVLLEKIVDAIQRIKAQREPNRVSARQVTQRLGEVASYCNAVIDQLEAKAAEETDVDAKRREELEAAKAMLTEFRHQVYQKLCELKEVGENGGPEELAAALNKLAEIQEGSLSNIAMN